MVELLVLWIACLTNVALGLTVYLKNPKSASSRLFLLLTLSFVLWSIVNYISVNPFFLPQVVWVRLVLSAAALQCLAVFLTFTVFPSDKMIGSKRLRRLAIGYTMFISLFVLTPYVFTVNDAGNPVPDKGMPLFALLVIGLFGGGVLTLIKKYRLATGHAKNQLRLVVLGLVGTFSLILINFLLIAVFNVTIQVSASPAFTLVFSGSVAYAIIKHGLFNIRSAAARTAAYLLSIGTVIGFYALIVIVLTSVNLLSSNISSTQRVLFAVLAMASGFLYSPSKRFFDRVTNKLFYRDTYDTQILLDDLNNTLVNNVELESLLTRCALILQETIKTSYATFYIRETSYFPSRIIGAHRSEPEIKHMDKIESLSPKMKKKIHLADDGPSNEYEEEINTVMRQNDFDVMARLVSTLDYEVKGIGYLFLGPKKSGAPYTKQDIKTLEIIANELVIGVENVLRFEEIQEFNVTLQRKIDDATKELQATNQKLLALDEAKDEFISMASHQLRTPLTSIKGYISMVMEGDAGPVSDTQKEMLGQAFFSSQRMVYLISDLLNVSRLKTGKFIIEPTSVYLPDLVESEITQLQEGAKTKNLTFTFDKPASFPTLLLDEMKLRQVIMNFTDNAIYYTPSHGKIEVSLKETPKSVEFRVKDTGIGVPKAERHKLFTKFYRAENARKTRPDGTGLGLFMAKKVVVAQGGSIIFDSKESKGSIFGFSFPKAKLLVDDKGKKAKSAEAQ